MENTQMVISELLTFIKPWLPSSAIILVITYGITHYFKKTPRELKASLPIALAIIAQIITHRPKNIYISFDFIGIGIAHGAVLTSVYDIILKRLKENLNKTKEKQ